MIRRWMFLVLDQEAIQTIEMINVPPEFDFMRSDPGMNVRQKILKAVGAMWEEH